MNDSRVRIHIVGIVVTALFCSLLARLWFLQVRENPTSVSISNQSTRTIRTPSSRGLIYDSEGRLLVGNRVSWAVTADPELRAASHTSKERKVVPLVAQLLKTDPNVLTKLLDSRQAGPLEFVVLQSDVSPVVRTQLAEHSELYPHVELAALDQRWYADPTLAPQLLGYLGRMTPDDVAKHADYGNNEMIGRTGIEAVYESMLRGTPSAVDVAVDPRGQVVGDPIHTYAGRPGYNVNLTINGDWQAFAQKALQAGIDRARTEFDEDLFKNGGYQVKYRATGGAVLVLDTRDGSVKAMASNPGYANSNSIGAQFAALTSKASNIPLLNRATRGLYAPGSTFKLVSSTASVQSGTFGEFTPVPQDDGCLRRGTTFKICQPGGGGGTVSLQRAITISSDIYFYKVGDALWTRWKNGDVQGGYAIQNEARMFGFGAKTGIDIGESGGTVPDEAWKHRLARAEYPNPLNKRDQEGYNANKGWNPGDNIGLAVGQGDLLVSPLQLADAYGALANGGTVWRPRLVNTITDASGHTVANAAVGPKARSVVQFPATLRDTLLAGFAGVVSDPNGTAYEAFRGLPASVGTVRGKTGTAQFAGKSPKPGQSIPSCIQTGNGALNFDKCIGDTSWFVSMYAPPGTDQSHPRYVILAMVEQGGRGGRIAAPIVRQIIEHMNGINPVTPIPQLTAGAGPKG